MTTESRPLEWFSIEQAAKEGRMSDRDFDATPINFRLITCG